MHQIRMVEGNDESETRRVMEGRRAFRLRFVLPPNIPCRDSPSWESLLRQFPTDFLQTMESLVGIQYDNRR
jgi:hypothetical protein